MYIVWGTRRDLSDFHRRIKEWGLCPREEGGNRKKEKDKGRAINGSINDI